MFHRLEKRARRVAENRAERKIASMAVRLEEELPGGVHAEPSEHGLLLSGRGLTRRLVVDAFFRNLINGAWR